MFNTFLRVALKGAALREGIYHGQCNHTHGLLKSHLCLRVCLIRLPPCCIQAPVGNTNTCCQPVVLMRLRENKRRSSLRTFNKQSLYKTITVTDYNSNRVKAPGIGFSYISLSASEKDGRPEGRKNKLPG